MSKVLAILDLDSIIHIENDIISPDYLILKSKFNNKDQKNKIRSIEKSVYDYLILHTSNTYNNIYIFKNANFEESSTLKLDNPTYDIEIDEDSIEIDYDIDKCEDNCNASVYKKNVNLDDYMFRMIGLKGVKFNLVKAEIEICNQWYNSRDVKIFNLEYDSYKKISGNDALKKTFLNKNLDKDFIKTKSYQYIIDILIKENNADHFYNNIKNEYFWDKSFDKD